MLLAEITRLIHFSKVLKREEKRNRIHPRYRGAAFFLRMIVEGRDVTPHIPECPHRRRLTLLLLFHLIELNSVLLRPGYTKRLMFPPINDKLKALLKAKAWQLLDIPDYKPKEKPKKRNLKRIRQTILFQERKLCFSMLFDVDTKHLVSVNCGRAKYTLNSLYDFSLIQLTFIPELWYDVANYSLGVFGSNPETYRLEFKEVELEFSGVLYPERMLVDDSDSIISFWYELQTRMEKVFYSLNPEPEKAILDEPTKEEK